MIGPETWLGATVSALNEVVTSYLDVDNLAAATLDADERPSCGAVVGLVSEENSVQIFLVASREGAEVLGKGLLGFEADEEIEMGDLADAMGEIVNIVVGVVKTAVNDEDSSLNLTLPSFVEGRLEPLGGQVVTHQIVMMGPVETKVLVINGNRAAKRQPRSSAA